MNNPLTVKFRQKKVIQFISGVILGMVSLTVLANPDYMDMDLVNNSKIADDNKVFILIKALNKNSADCLMKNLNTDKAVCEAVNAQTVAEDFSVPFSSLKKISDHQYRIHLPKVASGRIYFSIDNKMHMNIEPGSNKIVDPDGFRPRDPNFYTLYDKVEFSYNDLGSWVNPTAVDFFSIPLNIDQPAATTFVKNAGLSESRQNILNKIQTIFTEYDRTPDAMWNRLILKDAYNTNLIYRVVAPGKAMVSGVPKTMQFDPHYLSNPGFNYLTTMWDYYKTHHLKINCTEINQGIIEGTVNNANQFVFKNSTGDVVVVIDKPLSPYDSVPFFAGAIGPFDAPNNTPKAIVVRQLTSAFEVGLLPAPSNNQEKVVTLDKSYFDYYRKMFYQDSVVPEMSGGVTKGPWYDLYSKAFHLFEDQPIYTFAYDDALGQDGTLHDPNGSKVTVTIGDMTGTEIPKTTIDTTEYKIHYVIGSNSVVAYYDEATKSYKTLQNGGPLLSVKGHLTVKMNNNKPATIYIKYPMVLPSFPGADGIVIHSLDQNNNVEIIFPGK